MAQSVRSPGYLKSLTRPRISADIARRAIAGLSLRVIQRYGMLCEIYFPRQRVAIKGWPVRERIRLPHLILRTGHHVYHTTGFDREEIIDLCILINS